MQAASRITKNAIVMAEKQILRARIQLGSMTNGSSSSYVRLVVMPYLQEIAKINEILITDQSTTTETWLFECRNESIVIHSANSRVVKKSEVPDSRTSDKAAFEKRSHVHGYWQLLRKLCLLIRRPMSPR